MATTTNSGKDIQIRNITVTTSDTPIDFDVKYVSAVLIRARNSVDLYLREAINASDYFTIPGGTSLLLNVSSRKGISCYLRSQSGSQVVEVIGYIE